MNAHLQRAKEFISIAESADAKREAYERAADEIIAWQREDPTSAPDQAALAAAGRPR